MKILSQNRVLYVAIAVSVLIHAIVLSARFGSTLSFDAKKNTPAMELVLINPLPQKIINAAVGGAGNPVASTKKTVNGKTGKPASNKPEAVVPESSKANKVTGSAGRKTMNMTHGESSFQLPEEPDGRSVVFRRNVSGNGKGMSTDIGGPVSSGRPVITANTRDVGYAMYYKALRKKVENLGLINFPQRNGTRLYGELTVRIPVYRDGSLFEKEGGPSIERSSGNPALDKAALNIIRRAAPFGPFPKSMRSKNAEADVWIIITRLKFTRDQGIQSQIQSTVH
ncbi:TonB family protein [Oxalobacter aliiformigenes]|uniref:TonB family protein n=1 Tax=Oxalobacter aliiformigenes TaxID=2946593 RepID=A0A9E9LES8_9BURK|nr:TonB family protein [Oxalobacter aliiformigenes]WAV89666.1 TonB family protein [Oxalobacter aliiformigenes]WAV91677.1 TonB family protein [Oxalobacter aliiformigenes]WAV93769.1 TonB family protein [Oxalobacter aliiformigenes]WAV94728.1 TonB family protein [Oxalobacter aliiformigenes]WAV97463.1 TonB family protein [Oxalobacter aliiformigenes]